MSTLTSTTIEKLKNKVSSDKKTYAIVHFDKDLPVRSALQGHVSEMEGNVFDYNNVFDDERVFKLTKPVTVRGEDRHWVAFPWGMDENIIPAILY